jgi:hypothetical protein
VREALSFSVVSPDGKKVWTVRTMPQDMMHAMTDPRGFNGDGLAFVKAYRLKKEQPTLPGLQLEPSPALSASGASGWTGGQAQESAPR